MKGKPVYINESDRTREARIRELAEQVVSARNGEARHRALCAMQDEIRTRTPAAVAALEQARGLA